MTARAIRQYEGLKTFVTLCVLMKARPLKRLYLHQRPSPPGLPPVSPVQSRRSSPSPLLSHRRRVLRVLPLHKRCPLTLQLQCLQLLCYQRRCLPSHRLPSLRCDATTTRPQFSDSLVEPTRPRSQPTLFVPTLSLRLQHKATMVPVHRSRTAWLHCLFARTRTTSAEPTVRRPTAVLCEVDKFRC